MLVVEFLPAKLQISLQSTKKRSKNYHLKAEETGQMQ